MLRTVYNKGPHAVALLTEDSRDILPCNVEILRRGSTDNLSTAVSYAGTFAPNMDIQGVPGRNVPDFGRMFLTLKYTDITQNTYIRS